MTPEQKAATQARVKSLNEFLAGRKVPVTKAKALKAPRSAKTTRAVSPVRAPRRAASAPAKSPPRTPRSRKPRTPRSRTPLPAFGSVVRPAGYVQPQEAQAMAKKLKRAQEKQMQHAQLRAKAWNAMVPARRHELQRISATNMGEFNRIMDAQANQFEMRQASERLAKHKAQQQASAKKAKRAQQKQMQHAQLRLRAYNAASADKKKLIDLLGKQSGDLSAYNKLMNALAQQHEQRQIAQRKALYEGKSAAQKAQLDKITDPVLYDKKLREKPLAQRLAMQIAQKVQTKKALAQMRPQGPRPGQGMEAFHLRMSRQAAQKRMDVPHTQRLPKYPSFVPHPGTFAPKYPSFVPNPLGARGTQPMDKKKQISQAAQKRMDVPHTQAIPHAQLMSSPVPSLSDPVAQPVREKTQIAQPEFDPLGARGTHKGGFWF